MSITNNNQRIAKNSIFMTARMIAVMLITFYTSRIILEVLGVVDYGIYNVVAGFVSMFAFMSASLSAGIQRFYNFELGKSGNYGASQVFNLALIIQIAFAILLVIVIEPVGVWYLHNKMVLPLERMWAAKWVFQFAIITLVIHILQVPFTAAIMAHEKMAFYAIANVLNAILTLLGVWIIKGMSLDALVAYSLVVVFVALLSLIANIIYAKKNFPEIKLDFKYRNNSLLTNMLSFSGWNIFGTFGHMLKDQGVNLILNFHFGPIVNAARGIAMQINSALQSFVSNITIPVRPQMIQAYSQGNKQRSYNLTSAISKLSFIVLLLMALPIIIEIDYILHFWLGEQVPEYASIFAIVIIIDSLVLTLNSPISGLVHASGEMKNYQLFGGTMSIISVIFAYISVVIFDLPVLVFVAILLVDILRQIGAVIIVCKIEHGEFSTRDYRQNVLSPILKVTLLSIPIPLILHLCVANGLFRLACVVISSSLIIVFVTYLFGLNPQEKDIVNQITNRLKHKIKTQNNHI